MATRAGGDGYKAIISSVAEWYEKAPELIADLMLAGGKSPFAADLSSSEKEEYYKAQFFNPDGSPNQVGRQQELARLGVDQYLKTLGEMQKLHGTFYPQNPPSPTI